MSLDPSGTADGAAGRGAASERTPLPASGEPGDAGGCNGANEFASADAQSCYLQPVDTASWLDARAACIGWGGDLVRIESADEDAFLTARVAVDVWIGISDRAVEGTMRWADGSSLGYENWAGGQPDDFNAREDCGEKRVIEAGGWNDGPCDGAPRSFLCER